MPYLESITPSNGIDGVLSLKGSNFGNNASVMIGNTNCSVISADDNNITCQLSPSSAGNFTVLLRMDNIGYANRNLSFWYDLVIDGLSKTEGKKKIF